MIKIEKHTSSGLMSHLGKAAIVAALALMLPGGYANAADGTAFHYDAKSVKAATYHAAITNLANAVMFSGLGEKLIFSSYERDDWLRRSGYVTRPPMPDMGIVGVLYRSALPNFAATPDFSRPETLRWRRGSFDRTQDPAAQAWALLKIVSPEFHLQFHELPDNKIAALMMLPQARVQARALNERLRNSEGLFVSRDPKGRLAAPRPRDQLAVLWAASAFKRAATSPRTDYWHKAYRDLTKPKLAGRLADHAFAAVQTLPPTRPGDRGLAIAALGRYALIADEKSKRAAALDLIRRQANALKSAISRDLQDIGLAIFGLAEAGRLLEDKGLARAASDQFRSRLMPLWDETLGVFRSPVGATRIVYTPETVGAVIAALNAMRWHGPEHVKGEAAALYPRFFEGAIIRSGLLRGSPLALVNKKYLENRPAAHFAHPTLPDPVKTGIAPVFAGEVRFENGRWRITDPVFRTGPAMFLTNMLAIRSSDGRNDIFVPDQLLKGLGS